MLRLDHLVYAVRDLDEGARHFVREHGVASIEGGRHPGWGTANRIVPLGEGYVELLGVVDRAEARSSAFGAWVLERLRGGEGVIGWALTTDDIDDVARRLATPVARGSRITPGGVTLSWKLAGLERAMRDPSVPFFIEWEVPAELRPGRATIGHPAGPGRIAWVEVSGAREQIEGWIGEHDLPLRVSAGAPAFLGAGISTRNGETVLPGAGRG